MSKYKKLTDQDIDKGIKFGQFREEGVLVRNTQNGETVKVRKQPVHRKLLLPPTFIQVNNVTIYQADLTSIFDEIIKNRNIVLLTDLEEKYSVVLDLFNSYLTYGKHIDDLLKKCVETAVAFEKRIDLLANEMDLANLSHDGVNQFINVAQAYIRTLFIYTLASFLIYRDDFRRDTVILAKIDHLDVCLKNKYEQLLASSHYDEAEKNHRIDMKNSMYAQYLFNDKFSLLELDSIVEPDRRFSSSLGVVNFFKRFYKEENIDETDLYNAPNPEMHSRIYSSYKKLNPNDDAVLLIDNLRDIFLEIIRLRTCRQEIINIGSDKEAFELVRLGISLANKEVEPT